MVVTDISIVKINVTTVSQNKDSVKEFIRHPQLVALSATGY